MGISSRRAPYPWDALLNLGGSSNVGLLLQPTPDGQLVSRKTKTLENDPSATVTDYSSDPTYRQRTFGFRHLSGGMGERWQSSLISRRYRYMINAQRWGNLIGKGPLFHSLAPATSGSITAFAEGLNGGVVTQFILAGRYVLTRGGDSSGAQLVSRDFGAGRTVTSAVRFKGAYATPIDGLLVTTDDGQLWQYSGATWVAATLPAGFLPTALEVAGTELWAGGGNQVRKCTGDPLLAGSWSGAFSIGDGSSIVSCIRQLLDRPFVFTTNGRVFTFNGDGSDNDLFPGLRTTATALNGANAQAWLDAIWVSIGDSFLKLDALGGAQLTVVGPERLREAEAPVQGRVAASAGWGTQALYLGVYNAQTGHSMLETYGSWEPPPEDRPSLFRVIDATAAYQFVDTLDGALIDFPAQQITAMKVSGISAPDTRLYIGFSDGTYGWIKLVTSPFAAGSGAEFTLATSTVNVPLHHAMAQKDTKVTMGFTGFGPLLTTTDYATVSYRVNESAPYTALSAHLTANGQRVNTPDGTLGKLLDVQIGLVNTTTSDTPILEGLGIHERVVPAFELDTTLKVRAESYQAKRDGSVDRKTAEQIRAYLLSAAGSPGSVTFTLPDETVGSLAMIDFEEHLLNPNARAGPAWDITLTATQFGVLTAYGSIGRFRGSRIGDFRGFLIGQLANY
jgi:hypothetical protein